MIVAIIQARMGSTRLQGKVLMDVNGVPLLKILMRRVALSKMLDRIVIATSTQANDDPIAKFCAQEKIEVFRGSESDVLGRYYDCATAIGATTIVRLTGDCPFIDPNIIDAVITMFKNEALDYAANTVPPQTSTFPSGSDVEVFTYAALARAHREVKDPSYREHVTFYFWRDLAREIKTGQFRNAEDWSKYRLSVDYPEDLEVTRRIAAALCMDGAVPTLPEIIKYLELHPEVYALNSMYYFGQGWQKK
ncbi:MAG: glycosyltransferase family protein [Betaproteobacteria bacterium]